MEEQVHNLHSYDEQDLSVGLEELRARMDEVEDEHVAEAVGLSQLVVGISDAVTSCVSNLYDYVNHVSERS
jgi:hypothetical protein